MALKSTIRVGDKRRLVIPKRAAASLRLAKGGHLEVNVIDGVIVLTPVSKADKLPIFLQNRFRAAREEANVLSPDFKAWLSENKQGDDLIGKEKKAPKASRRKESEAALATR